MEEVFESTCVCVPVCVGGWRNRGRKGEQEREKPQPKKKKKQKSNLKIKKQPFVKFQIDVYDSLTARSARLPVPVTGWQATLVARTGSLIRLQRDKWSSSCHLRGFLWQFAIYTSVYNNISLTTWWTLNLDYDTLLSLSSVSLSHKYKRINAHGVLDLHRHWNLVKW